MNSTPARTSVRLDRYTRIGELGDSLHLLLRNGIVVIAIIVILLVLKLFFQSSPGWLSLLCVGTGVCVSLVAWQSCGVGLPMLPLIAIQHFAVYGMPIVNRNTFVTSYPESLIDKAGMEVLIMLVTCSAAWLFGMQIFRPGKPVAHALHVFATHGNSVMNRIGIALIGIAAGYELLKSLNVIGTVMSVLPDGAQSIVVAIIIAAGMSGYFLVAMFVASGEARSTTRTLFWIILTGHLVLLTSSILLSSVINIVGAVVIGLFWGSGKTPRIFLLICTVALSFLNIGKFDMRERYWGPEGQISSNVTITALPKYYMEWIGYSSDRLFGNSDLAGDQGGDKAQTMLIRMDNMQNLLYVVNSVSNDRTPLLEGETYAIIPPLLIPRIFWPEKPRTHEGQVMLNVHFGRQSRADSFNTYVAWGLLPEAYGNFGAFWGAVFLGCILGLFSAWLENATVAKPLLSMEGMVTFALFIGIASSFEMVSSVLITSLFQSVTIIAMSCLPFVQKMTVIRPEEPELSE